jgi:hypothetical protein
LSLLNLLLGRALATYEERAEQIGPLKGIPVFGLDALGSAAYGAEAALALLIPMGLAGLKWEEYIGGPAPFPAGTRSTAFAVPVGRDADCGLRQEAGGRESGETHHQRDPRAYDAPQYHWLLHTQRAEILKGRLLLDGNDRISVLNIPWYQKAS